MKKFASLIISVLAVVVMTGIAAAQQPVQGTVTINGTVNIMEYTYVCPGASIQVNQIFGSTTTNSNGYYQIKKVVQNFSGATNVVATADWTMTIFGTVNIRFTGTSAPVSFPAIDWPGQTWTRTANIAVYPNSAWVTF
ncbi:MAG: hypothetical protein K6U11_03120 [bacterium]|nr:hypothetical protein [bacterium]